MILSPKNKFALKSQIKPTSQVKYKQTKPITIRKQPLKNIQQQVTSRNLSNNIKNTYSKSINNNNKTSNAKNKQNTKNSQRSPQLIKLMINQLQRQLKTKQFQNNNQVLNLKQSTKNLKQSTKNLKQSSKNKPKKGNQQLKMNHSQKTKQIQYNQEEYLNKTKKNYKGKLIRQNEKSPKNINFDQTQSSNKTTKVNWRSPNKKKNQQLPQQFQQLNINKLNQNCIQTNIHKLNQTFNQNLNNTSHLFIPNNYTPDSTINNIKNNNTSKRNPSKKSLSKKSHPKTKQNYLFLGDNLIHLPNIQVPLFIVQNKSQLVENSNIYTSRDNQNRKIKVDQKSGFFRHSKVASFDSVDTQNSTHIKYIQRSFCENNELKTQNEEKQIQLINFSKLIKQQFVNKQKKTDLSYQKSYRKQDGIHKQNNLESPPNLLDINKIIQLNNCVLKIQKWWKRVIKNSKQRKQIQKQQQTVQVKKSLQTIQTKQQNSHKIIPIINTHNNTVLDTNQIKEDYQPKSHSQKLIDNRVQQNDYYEHNDILKLRQNAAYLQYQTHQKILKQLLSKNKINSLQYQQKKQQIRNNLQNQLNDINKIKDILKQSALKVQNIMKKTKQDILVIKNLNTQNQNQTNHQSYIAKQTNQLKQNNNNKITKNKQYLRNITQNKQQDILVNIFGKQQKSSPLQLTSNQPNQISSVNQQKLQKQFLKKCIRLKASTFQREIEQFLYQSNQQNHSNSFNFNHNNIIFNSPNLRSQEDLDSLTHQIGSPNNQTNKDNQQVNQSQELNCQQSEEQFIEQDEFSQQIQQASSGISVCNSISIPTANFQQLYKQYQQQQQTKQLIQLRSAKQLGVNQPQLFLKSQNQIGINTSIVAIHKFLLNFFKYYLYYHKNQFLNYMNMPYGQSIQTRLNKNKLSNPQTALQQWTKTSFYTDDDQQIIYGLKTVIPESVLQDFFQSYYQQTDIQFSQVQKTNIQLQKIHNKAVFQAFNQGLNFFRPYFGIGGAPYVWCSSQKSLTFYCIGEQNIQQVYEKTQMKILKISSYLCGLNIEIPNKKKIVYTKDGILDKQMKREQIESPFKIMQNKIKNEVDKNIKQANNFEQYMKGYTDNFNSTYFINLEDRLKKKQANQTQEENQQWYSNTFQQGKVATLLNLSDLIEEIVFLEQCSIIKNIQNQRIKIKNTLQVQQLIQ